MSENETRKSQSQPAAAAGKVSAEESRQYPATLQVTRCVVCGRDSAGEFCHRCGYRAE
jgi:hypothetical protein